MAQLFNSSFAPLWINSPLRTDNWRMSCRNWQPRRSQPPTGRLRLQRSFSGACVPAEWSFRRSHRCVPGSLMSGGSSSVQWSSHWAKGGKTQHHQVTEGVGSGCARPCVLSGTQARLPQSTETGRPEEWAETASTIDALLVVGDLCLADRCQVTVSWVRWEARVLFGFWPSQVTSLLQGQRWEGCPGLPSGSCF